MAHTCPHDTQQYKEQEPAVTFPTHQKAIPSIAKTAIHAHASLLPFVRRPQ
jgi:hypothetical protein